MEPASRTFRDPGRDLLRQPLAAMRGPLALRPEDPLSSARREIAAELVVSPRTAAGANRQLEREGVADLIGDEGTFVPERARGGAAPNHRWVPVRVER